MNETRTEGGKRDGFQSIKKKKKKLRSTDEMKEKKKKKGVMKCFALFHFDFIFVYLC